MAGRIMCLMMLMSIAWAVMAADEDGCYIPEANKVVPVGAVVKPIGQCIRIKCISKGSINILTCAEEVSADPKCRVTGYDLSVKYPDCCPKFECD